MDFDERLEAAELMWKLLGLTSSDCLLAQCQDLNTRCETCDVTGDNQLLRGDTDTSARPITVIIVMSGPRKEKIENTRTIFCQPGFCHQMYYNVNGKISSFLGIGYTYVLCIFSWKLQKQQMYLPQQNTQIKQSMSENALHVINK